MVRSTAWLKIWYITADDVGNYTCFANSSVGEVESVAASLTIGGMPLTDDKSVVVYW